MLLSSFGHLTRDYLFCQLIVEFFVFSFVSYSRLSLNRIFLPLFVWMESLLQNLDDFFQFVFYQNQS